MYHPTTRLLTILELLQTHNSLGGEELARRLEVEPRSIRRYIQMLQDMGMPIEGSRGPGGGYRLRPGFKLPPLLFTEEEATALILGLLGTSWLEIELSSVAIEGALAKIYRVLPLKGRERLQAISSYIMLATQQHEARPAAATLVTLSEAVQQQRRIGFSYTSHHNNESEREMDPYGVAASKGHWYVAGYCRLRQEFRLFRLDRMQNVQLLTETFTRDKDFNYRDFILQRLATIPARYTIEIMFKAPLHLVKHKIPPAHGQLNETAEGIHLKTHHVHLPEFARYLVALNLPFTILHPPELKSELLTLAEDMRRIALDEQESAHEKK